MPRPKKPRFVSAYPAIVAFVDQETAANMMEVSRHTYGRILANARSIVAGALITGKVLKIGGGAYEFRGMGGRRRRRGGGGRGHGRR